MRRRDTIIIAVLVNAGLLLVLFATAMRSGDKKKEEPAKLAELSLPTTLPTRTGDAPLSTEELLNEYIASTTLPQGQQEMMEIVDLSTAQTTNISVGAAIPQAPNAVAIQTPGPQTHGPILQQNVPSSMHAVPIVPAVTVPGMPAPAVEKEQVVEVTVKKGDYLEKIAKANNSTVNAIMKASNLASTQLKIGQVLKVPVVKGKEGVKETATAAVNGDYYIVKEGDSPWAIANKCHVKLDDLLKLNNIDNQKAKHLRPGDKLRIR